MAFVTVQYGPFRPVSGFFTSRRSPSGSTAADVTRYPYTGGAAPASWTNVAMPSTTVFSYPLGMEHISGAIESPWTATVEDSWQMFVEFDVSSVPWVDQAAGQPVDLLLALPEANAIGIPDNPDRPTPWTEPDNFTQLGVILHNWTRAGDDTDFIGWDSTAAAGWDTYDQVGSERTYRPVLLGLWGGEAWIEGAESTTAQDVIDTGVCKLVVGPHHPTDDQNGARNIRALDNIYGWGTSRGPSLFVQLTVEVADPEPEYLGWVVGAVGWGVHP